MHSLKRYTTLAAWGFLAAVSPAVLRAQAPEVPGQVYYPPPGTYYAPSAPVIVPPGPPAAVAFSAPPPGPIFPAPPRAPGFPTPPVVDAASVYYSYARPTARPAPGITLYSTPLTPGARSLPVRYSLYQLPVSAPIYNSPVYTSPASSGTYYKTRGSLGVYNYNDYGPFAYTPAYGSAYYTPLYFRQ